MLARRYLIEQAGVDEATVEALKRADVLEFFTKTTGADPWQTRQLLWDTYQPYDMWMIFMAIGVISMFLLVIYDRVVSGAEADPNHSFNVSGAGWVRGALVPITLSLAAATVYSGFGLGLAANTFFFAVMTGIAFYERSLRT